MARTTLPRGRRGACLRESPRTSLIEAGMTLKFPHEHERPPWKLFPSMAPAGSRMLRLPDGAGPMALAFSLRTGGRR